MNLLEATDLRNATRSTLVAASFTLFAECGLSPRDPEALSNLGALLADGGATADVVDGVMADVLGVGEEPSGEPSEELS